MEKAIEYHMLAYEARHLRAWQRAKHADLLHQEISSPKKIASSEASVKSLEDSGAMSNRLQRQPSKLRIRNKRAIKKLKFIFDLSENKMGFTIHE